MKPGPKRTPTSILKLRGSLPHQDRDSEPQPDTSMPAKPAWLKKKGARVWKARVGMFYNMGVLTAVDADAFACYCDLLATLEWMKKEQPNNIFDRLKVMKSLREYGTLFGWSPADRARLKVDKPVEQNPFVALKKA